MRGSGDVTIYMIANLVNLGIRVSVAKLCSPIWGIRMIWFVNYLISFLRYRTGRWQEKALVSKASQI